VLPDLVPGLTYTEHHPFQKHTGIPLKTGSQGHEYGRFGIAYRELFNLTQIRIVLLHCYSDDEELMTVATINDVIASAVASSQ